MERKPGLQIKTTPKWAFFFSFLSFSSPSSSSVSYRGRNIGAGLLLGRKGGHVCGSASVFFLLFSFFSFFSFWVAFFSKGWGRQAIDLLQARRGRGETEVNSRAS